MSGSGELLALRLGLIGILLLFVLIASYWLSRGLRASGPAARPSRAGARLLVSKPGKSGLAAGTEFVLAGSTTLGRDDDAGIQLGDASVSGRHALMERRESRWAIRDLGSMNGTLVNGRPAGNAGMLLSDGARLALGVVELIFRE